jgi:hypothetical protein
MDFKILYYFSIIIINSDFNISTSGARVFVNTYSIMCFVVYVMMVNNLLNGSHFAQDNVSTVKKLYSQMIW